MNFREAWCRETCHPAYRDKWSVNNPSVGQCLCTALCVQDEYGGEIWSCKVGRVSHFVNILSDGTLWDITREQFGEGRIVYSKMNPRSRESLLKNKDVRQRYLLLKERLNEEVA